MVGPTVDRVYTIPLNRNLCDCMCIHACVCLSLASGVVGCFDSSYHLSSTDIHECPSLLSSLLTLWFELGGLPEVQQVLVEGMKTVPKNTWLQVVPQLIARIDSPKDLVRNLIHSLLVDVGKQHPQVGGNREGRGGEKERKKKLLAAIGSPRWSTV